MAKAKLTQRTIRQTTCPYGQQKLELCDTTQPGFYVEYRYGNQYGTYYQRFRDESGKQKSRKIGLTSELLLKDARKLAADIKIKASTGELALEKQQRLALVKQYKTSITFNDFYQQTYLPHAIRHKRPKTLVAEASIYRNYVERMIGNMSLNSISKKHLLRLQSAIQDKGIGSASNNKAINLIRVTLRYAIDLEMMEDASALSVKLLPSSPHRERYLSNDELSRLWNVLNQWDNQHVAVVIQFCLVTGARSGEVKKANWSDINLDQGTWHIPVENDKVKKGRTIPLNDTAIAVLKQAQGMSRPNQIEVFTSSTTGKPYHDITLSWYKIRALADVGNCRIHDLRHSFASFLVNNKVPIAEVSLLLGHNSIKTTMRYAHLDQTTILASSRIMDGLIAGTTHQRS